MNVTFKLVPVAKLCYGALRVREWQSGDARSNRVEKGRDRGS